MNKFINNGFLVLCGMIVFAALTRLLPHYPNFTAIGAMALFGGAYFSNRKLAYIVPLTAMFLTDLIIGTHSTMIPVYFSFIIIVSIGIFIGKNKTAGRVTVAAIASSVIFFIITNFGMWIAGTMYPKNLIGLTECYIAAVPFFHYTAMGDLFYSAVLFGSYELVRVKFPKLAIN